MLKNVVVIKNLENNTMEVWGSLTAICNAHSEFQYHTIKVNEFPFEHKGYEFHKLKYNHKYKK